MISYVDLIGLFIGLGLLFGYSPQTVNAIILLKEVDYLGVTTCTSSGATLVSTFYYEVNVCVTDEDFSTMYTCDGIRTYFQADCKGSFTTSSVKGCQSGVNNALEYSCVDANWYRVKQGNDTKTCNATTNTQVIGTFHHELDDL
jgi:hypothetical protein